MELDHNFLFKLEENIKPHNLASSILRLAFYLSLQLLNLNFGICLSGCFCVNPWIPVEQR